jgi:acetyl-CoA carboxylase biotin carboxyl carrier protein
MALTHDDVKSLIEIIDRAEHLQEMELTWGDFQLHIWRGGETARPVHATAAVATAPLTTAKRAIARSPSAPDARASEKTATEVAAADNEVVIRAPMLGTFYRAASPGDKPFVEVGQQVRPGDTVCLIEVMKLFNSIRAGVVGKVSRILHENGSLVEFNQALIVIATAER